MQLEIKSASYTYLPGNVYEKKAVSDISLKIEQGEFVGIMGQTGSGKSTLLQLLGGLLKPDTGRVLFNHEDINSRYFNHRMFRKRVGVLFQFPDYQLFETTVFRDIAFGLKNSGCTKSEIETAVKEAIETVGFDYEQIKNKSPLAFSGGEKRKLAIAGVIAAKPDVLLLDEPVSGLDSQGKAEFLSLLQKLHQNGTTVVMISHSADVLAEYASRIIFMKNGRIMADGNAADVLSDFALLSECGVSSAQVCELSQKLCRNEIYIADKTIQYNQLLNEICRIFGRADL